MVSDGLTPEQRILLQCAATTGGEPIGFATCSGDRLMAKELIQCADNKFAEDDCFGKNNEIRKCARNVLGTDIGPNSVVAKVADLHLDVIKAQISFAQNTGREIERTAKNVGKEAKRFEKSIRGCGKSAEKSARRALKKTEEKIKSEAKKVEKTGRKIIKRIIPRIDIKIKSPF